jgi:DNA-binding MurR/RpiR family transcriptional regulator
MRRICKARSIIYETTWLHCTPEAAISIETEIYDAMHRLTAAEKRAARGLLANYPTLALGPVADFAKGSGASPATILRFIAQLGFDSYPDFQRRLREELEERIKSPLQKTPPQKGKRQATALYFSRFAEHAADNIRETAAKLPQSEFEALAARLADARHSVHILGGRFTDPIAAYLTAHLRVVRPSVRHLEARAASAGDQLLDVKAGDCAVIFDIRRYDDGLLKLAYALAGRRARVALITDNWISPVSRVAKYVLPCAIDVGRTWDSSAALFVASEALIARVTELSWDEAETRIKAKEGI